MIIRKVHKGGVAGLIQRIAELGDPNILIGVPSENNKSTEGEINMATLAAVHELGATIKHGGGIRYQKNANGNLAKFMSHDFVGPTSGVTGAHTIKIPERSFIRSTLNENKDKYIGLMIKGFQSVLEMKDSTENIYNKIGLVISNDVKQKMVNGPFTPLSPATIRKKGSSKPLIDTGELRNSITWQVK